MSPNADFISKLEGALQEAEETIYWLELLGGVGIVADDRLHPYRAEASELIAIMVTMVKNTKARGR